MKLAASLVALVAVGCGASESPSTSDSGTNAGEQDAALIGGGIVDTVPCKTNVRSVNYSDGTRIESRTYFIHFDGVTLGDDFAIELCDRLDVNTAMTPPATCPTGATCSSGGDPLPSGAYCSWVSDAYFIENSLYYTCGTGTAYFNASNVETGKIEARYQTVRVHH